ncbi:hypothetical protein [Leptospira noguchii]|uniref:Uncharacterized protein n=1 Tax=Leptospira noguchii TaxID=28182 RepID=A0AAE9GC07_9LEPT|nr:hypothetical protein [Leptospira noguchii]UOG31165.1 hypothetical protein MAL06_03675 [Leptospira noguchii]UOG34796.1 hypothetical protein MAL02_03330 [Leptospira noguchii]UOG45690.1 hypothetical protein MAL01_03425 [Leptospira noguchii]UOG57276.1 hypothetical protein MAL03_03620 [Leptospira noguchii]
MLNMKFPTNLMKKMVLLFCFISISFLNADDLNIKILTEKQIANLPTPQVLRQIRSMEKKLHKLNEIQIGYLDRLKVALQFKEEKGANNYKKENTTDYVYYDPSASYIYTPLNANLNLIRRGAEKNEVLKYLKTIYQWDRLEEVSNVDPAKIPIVSQKTVYEKYFYTEYTKYLYYKVHCKKNVQEGMVEECGPWTEYEEELNRMLKKYKIDDTSPLEKNCECMGC